MINNPFHVVVSYNAPFLLTLNSQLSKLFFFQACQQLDAKMAANSNLALILGHCLYKYKFFKLFYVAFPYNMWNDMLVTSTFTRITRARWMILVREKCRTNLPCEPNKRHLQNRARFNRACWKRIYGNLVIPNDAFSFFSPLPQFVLSLSLSLSLFMMDHRREFCNEIKFCQKHFCRLRRKGTKRVLRRYSLCSRYF